jgi:hypothetical protein
MDWLNEKANKEIVTYILSNLNKISVKSGQCRFNFRCHNNAVNDAIVNNESKIAMVLL